MKISSFIAAALLSCALVLVAMRGVSAQESAGWQLGGSVLEQAYASYSGSGGFDSGDFGYGSATTLGLNLDARGDRARASVSLEGAVLDGAAAQAAWLRVQAGQAPADELLLPAKKPAGGKDMLAAARIRTLYVKLDEDWVALIAGRQVINYQRGALWSPTDLFTELDLSGLSPVRLGSDALRLIFPLGATGAADFVAAPSTLPEVGAYSARLSGLLLGVDGALSAGRDGAKKRSYFGADFKADLELGFYGDLLYALPDSGGRGEYRAAAGADWSAGDFVFAAEYYYNGGGEEADLLFPDSHNLYGDLLWRVSELLNVSASTICDLGAASGSATLLAALSAAQNATLSFYVETFWGPGLAAAAGQAGATLEVSF